MNNGKKDPLNLKLNLTSKKIGVTATIRFYFIDKSFAKIIRLIPKKFKKSIIILIFGWFYWFEYRPSRILIGCEKESSEFLASQIDKHLKKREEFVLKYKTLRKEWSGQDTKDEDVPQDNSDIFDLNQEIKMSDDLLNRCLTKHGIVNVKIEMK